MEDCEIDQLCDIAVKETQARRRRRLLVFFVPSAGVRTCRRKFEHSSRAAAFLLHPACAKKKKKSFWFILWRKKNQFALKQHSQPQLLVFRRIFGVQNAFPAVYENFNVQFKIDVRFLGFLNAWRMRGQHRTGASCCLAEVLAVQWFIIRYIFFKKKLRQNVLF